MSASGAASKGAGAESAVSLPWVEKYRPRTVDDVVHQTDVTKSLKRALESGNLPHLLFYGPPGTGKTSTILALARDMFGDDFRKRNVLELNASDERGIQVVRDKVRAFAKTMVAQNKTGSTFKIIILDEADCMTADAQAALRRTMEAHSKITRFCLICNYVSRIIDPLASRCAKFRFQPLARPAMAERLRLVAGEEGATLDQEACDAILDAAEGDMRRAMMLLQSAFRLGGAVITAEVVHEASGRLAPAEARRIVETLRRGGYEDAERCADDLFAGGFATDLVLSQLYDEVASSEQLSDEAKARIAAKFAEADKRIADGASERAQLLDCLAAAVVAAKA